MKKFLDEFKKFALRGNVMDMAIGVIIGAAFQDVIKSFTENIINPLIGIAFKVDFSKVVLHLPGNVDLGIGSFISAIINFILMALILFLFVKGINKADELLKKQLHEEEEEAPAPAKSDESILLEQILDELKKQDKVQ